MMLRRVRAGSVVAFGFALAATAIGAAPLAAQEFPLPSAKGKAVSPAFEGWYENKDGTFSISFGYYNRNSDEVIDIPIGPDNFVSPGPENQGQPTRFYAKRNWGVFTITVPKDFGTKQVVWTLNVHGTKYAIPGNLRVEWQIDALEGEAGSGNTPPAVKFSESGPEGSGPAGVTTGPLAAKVGQALPLTLWATDDGNSAGAMATDAKSRTPVTVAWFKHQGPGDVIFSTPTARLTPTGGKTSTNAMFSAPGDYILRARVNDASGVAGGGHAQCCWTNGFVKVTVSQ